MFNDESKNLILPEYHLYVALPEAIRATDRHYLITPDYCLIYTDEQLPADSATEIKNLHMLPASAWEWLAERINIIRAEYLIQHKEEVLEEAKKAGRKMLELLKKTTERDKEVSADADDES